MKLKIVENEPLQLRVEEDGWKGSVLSKLENLKELIKNGTGGGGEIHFPKRFEEFLNSLDDWTDYVEQEFQKSTQRDEEQSNEFALKILELENKFQSTIDAATKKILDKPVSTEADFTEIIDSITDAKKELEENLSTLNAGELKKIASVQDGVDELKTQSAATQDRIDAISISINTLDTKTDKIQSSIQNIKVETGLEEKVDTINSKADSIQTSVDNINNTEVVELINDLDTKVREIKALGDESKGSITKIDSTLSEAKASIEEVKTSIKNIDNTEIINAIQGTSTKIDTIQTSVNNLSSTISNTIIESFENTSALITDQSAQIDSISSKEDIISNKISVVEEKINELGTSSVPPSLIENMGTIKQEVGKIDANLGKAIEDLNIFSKRVYGYEHGASLKYSLETEYSNIIKNEPTLESVSSVGFIAILKDGEKLTLQGNRMFINGTEEVKDYEFKGENSSVGTEIVNVWYFGNSVIRLTEDVDFIISKIILKKIATDNFTTTITNNKSYVNPNYYNYANEVTTEGFIFEKMPLSSKTINYTNISQLSTMPINLNTKYINCEAESFVAASNGDTMIYPKDTNGSMTVNYNSIVLNFNNLLTIKQQSTSKSFIRNCPNAIIKFNKIQELSQAGKGETYALFGIKATNGGVDTVILPDTVKTITGCLFNVTVNNVELNCKDAIISDTIFSSYQKFTGNLTLCDDWGASINLVNATTTWTIQDFVELFGKLRDMTLTGETRSLTIPSAKLTEIQADTEASAKLAEAQLKGWTIGGA